MTGQILVLSTDGLIIFAVPFSSVVQKRFREGTFFLGGGGLGNFGIFSQKSVGPPLRFN